MKRFPQRTLSADDEENKKFILNFRASKEIALSCFSPDVRENMTKIFEEMLCEFLFDIHMELRMNIADPKWFSAPCDEMMDTKLLELAINLNITKGNQDVECPNCCILVKCPWMSKHLAGCGNSQQNTYSYSSRNSSRIARQRIQEGFKTSYDESKLDDDDDDKQIKIKPKKRNNKTKKKPAK
ncbi:Hypothetical protein CINCED_3A012867 [Cinara cedri]|uniref:Uncharacterized protein n=1 Tax=Cinara cedri TaxID=506608 RepID=A0A5E4MGD4_9HEMI|nr:Hypothetical protein CINCED_3A012867 [Cinara cedri]